MTYATAQQFASQFGLTETALLLMDGQQLVTPETLAAALEGGQVDDHGDEEYAAVLAALSRLETALSEAAALMDGYLRNVASLPLSPEQVAAAPLKTCCLELARNILQDDDENMTEGTALRAKRWMDWLRDVSAGRVKLLPEQKAVSTGVVSGRIPSRYDWGNYG